MSEVEEIGQAAGRAGSAVLSAALGVARELMRQRAEKAEQARRDGERRQIEIARQLHADRETAAVGWQRVNLRQWFRESPQEVARTWASAATWAPHDPRAREAFESLNLHLDRLGVHEPEVAQAMRDAGNYDGLAGLLKQGAEEARGQAPTGAATQMPDQDVAGWQRVTLAAQLQDSPQDVAQVWASAATWAPYDPAARETFESLNPQLARLGIEVPEVGEALAGASAASELGTLLEQGAEFQSAMEVAADWNAFLDTYNGRPYEQMWSALDTYLQQWEVAEPAYVEALRQAATNAGSEDLAAWYLSHPSEAYQLFRARVEQPAAVQDGVPTAEALAPMPRNERAQPVSVSEVSPVDPAERRPQAHPRAAATQTYQNGSAAAQLAGQGFATSTADAVRTGGGKHRQTRATTHRQSRQSRSREEQGRG
jgi:hypothetical protein